MKIKLIEGQFGDLRAWGKTKTEAKTKVMELAERACTGSYQPTLKRMGQYMYIVWRETESWFYQVIDLREPFVRFRGYTSAPSLNEAVRSVEYHVACLMRDDGEDMEKIVSLIEGLVNKQEFLYYWAWQDAFAASDPALPEMQRRAWADTNRHTYYEQNYRHLVA